MAALCGVSKEHLNMLRVRVNNKLSAKQFSLYISKDKQLDKIQNMILILKNQVKASRKSSNKQQKEKNINKEKTLKI